MFLYNCIGFTYITDNILSLINKCNIFINNSQILKCLDKQYIYSKYCNITNDVCNCIENKIIHDYSILDIKYYLINYIRSSYARIHFPGLYNYCFISADFLQDNC